MELINDDILNTQIIVMVNKESFLFDTIDEAIYWIDNSVNIDELPLLNVFNATPLTLKLDISIKD